MKSSFDRQFVRLPEGSILPTGHIICRLGPVGAARSLDCGAEIAHAFAFRSFATQKYTL